MGKLPGKGGSDCKRIIVCPVCKTIQKLGSDCGICKAPLYAPYLKEINGKLTIKLREEEEDGS